MQPIATKEMQILNPSLKMRSSVETESNLEEFNVFAQKMLGGKDGAGDKSDCISILKEHWSDVRAHKLFHTQNLNFSVSIC